jgi:ParB-like chromosome segregation protein Spo0J
MLEIENVNISEIRPFKNNAKLHPKEQVAQIVKSITEFGFNDPIAISETGEIIEGHGRLLAVQELGYSEVPCIRLTHLNEEQRRAYILAHNKLTVNTGFDTGLRRI